MRDKRGLLGFIFLAIVALLPHLHAMAQAAPPTVLTSAYGIELLSDRADYRRQEVYVEVRNNNTWEACDVRLLAKFYDSANTLLVTSTAYPMLAVVPVGGKAPVAVFIPRYFYDPSLVPVHHYSVEVVGATPCTIVRKPLTLLSAGLTNPPTGLEVSGVVRNDTALTLDRGKVVVTFYRSDGRIWFAYYSAIISKPLIDHAPPWLLPPGGMGAYIVVTGAKDLAGLGYTIQAQAEPATNQWVIQ